MSLYYRGAILNRLGRNEEAIVNLDQSMVERPDLTSAREEKGEALWQLGRRDEAVAVWGSAIEHNSALPVVLNMLAGAALTFGKPETANDLVSEASKYTPTDPRYHWMLGLRLKNLGMDGVADKHFAEALKLDPQFQIRLEWNSLEKR